MIYALGLWCEGLFLDYFEGVRTMYLGEAATYIPTYTTSYSRT
jgi:hypothetical protein